MGGAAFRCPHDGIRRRGQLTAARSRGTGRSRLSRRHPEEGAPPQYHPARVPLELRGCLGSSGGDSTRTPPRWRRGRPAATGGSSTGGPTPSPPPCSQAGLGQQAKVAQYLYNAPSISSRSSPASRRAWSPSTPTTATPRPSSTTCGTTPTSRRWCSTAPSWPGWRRCGPGCRRIRSWLWVDDGSAAVPDVGDPVRAGRRGTRPGGPVRGPWGP